MVATTAAGSTLAISAGVPATLDVAGYAALTYTEIGDCEKIGTFGATTEKVEFQPLKGGKQKFKGPTDYGSLQPSLAHNKTDAGQTLLRTAADPDNNALFAYRVVLPSGDKRYFRGRVFGYPEAVEGANSIVMANPTIEIDTKVVKDDAA